MRNKNHLIKRRVIYWCILFAIFLAIFLEVSTSAVFDGNKSISNNKIDENLLEIINSQSSENITVIIVLKEQPAHDIGIKVKKEYEKQFQNITEPANAVYNRLKSAAAGKKQDNISVIIDIEQSLLKEQDKILLKDVGDKVESKTREMRRAILNQTIPIADRTQEPVIRKIQARGGSIQYSGKIFNSITACIPVSYIDELSRDPAVYKIYGDFLLKTNLDVSTPAIGADISWWNNGYNGYDMDAAVVDTGIDETHPALNVDYSGVFHANAIHYYPSFYADNSTDPDDLVSHGTHVAGIVASNDSIYRGPGYGIDKLINAKAGWKGTDGNGYMLWSDAMEAFNWSIFGNADDADVMSYSFGSDSPTNGNDGFEHFLDAIAYDLDVPIIVANGNSGPGSQTVGQPAGAFNILSIGSVDDKNSVNRIDDSIAGYSSRGPTQDGRIKPDISAPGSNIMSANYRWETGPDFVSKSGTSMAAPMITGSILLIMDYKNMRWRPEAIKALLLNTAEDKGTTGPDNDYGFGYVNLSNTYIHRDNVYTDVIDDLPDGSVEKFYKGVSSNGDRATLVWNRHVVYNGPDPPTSYLTVSDLDLFLYNEASGAQISSSESRLNNIEQVESDADYGSVILKIDAYGSFPSGITLEDYALASDEALTNVSPPAFNINISNPENVTSGDIFILNATVNNTGDINAHSVNISVDLPSGFIIISGANPQTIGTLEAGNLTNASWMIRAPNVFPGAEYVLNVSASSNSYGESFSGTGNNSIIVLADETPPSSVTDLINITYESNYINWTWIDPVDLDFAKVEIYINDVYKTDVLKGLQYYNATDLEPWTLYNISTKTVDSTGNNNSTFVSHNASTKPPSIRYINGTLLDSINHTPISGGMVFTNMSSSSTDGSGFYSLIVAAGTYNLTATSDPVYVQNNSITVSTEYSVEVIQDIELVRKPTGTISGSVNASL